MWQTIKKPIKAIHEWYDSQGEISRFWPLVGATILGLVFINSDTAIIAFIGWIYFAFLIGTRWMYLNGKL